MSPIQNILTRLERVKPHGNYHMARCPVHEDNHESLSVSEGQGGKVLLKCHAGCGVRQIVEALGLTMSDLSPPKEKPEPAVSCSSLIARYSYTDENAKLLFEALRYQPKEFKQRAPDGKGGWLWSLQGVRRVPYNLPKVIEQGKNGGTVFVVEGEKDADALAALGLIATTNAAGAGKWLPEFGKYLTGAHVVILPDNDEPGQKHGQEVAASCFDLAASVRIVELPGLPQKGDVSDWLKKEDAAKERLLEIVKAVPVMKNISGFPFQGTGKTPENTRNSLSEYVNAETPPVFASPPVSLETELLPVATLTPEMVPPPLRAWLCDMAQRLSCPLEFVAIPAVVALGSVIGRKVGIRPKKYDDWLEYPNLWGAIIGRPGALKTPAISEALKPLHKLEMQARTQHEIEKENYLVSQMISKADGDASKDKLKSLAKSKDPNREEMRKAAVQAIQGETQEPPTCVRRIVNDTTVEKLGELLRENPNGLLMYRDELTGFLRTLERQGHESDRAFYLEAWNGKGCFTYDRIGRGTVFLPALCLSLVGTIQPGPLSSYLRGISNESGDDGFTSRFQLLVWPDPVAYRLVDRYSNTDAKQAAAAVFDYLATLAAVQVQAEVDDDGIAWLRFAPEAQQMFYVWLEGLEQRMRGTGETPLMETHLSKYRKLIPALALIFHLVEVIDETSPMVSSKALARALDWARFLETHARRIYQAVGEGDPEACHRLGQRIKQSQSLPNPFTVRQVVQKHWSGLSTTEEVERAVALLEERGWVHTREIQKAGGGRPSVQVWINPVLLSEALVASSQGDLSDSAIPTTATLQNLQNHPVGSSVGFVASPYQESTKFQSAVGQGEVGISAYDEGRL